MWDEKNHLSDEKLVSSDEKYFCRTRNISDGREIIWSVEKYFRGTEKVLFFFFGPGREHFNATINTGQQSLLPDDQRQAFSSSSYLTLIVKFFSGQARIEQNADSLTLRYLESLIFTTDRLREEEGVAVYWF